MSSRSSSSDTIKLKKGRFSFSLFLRLFLTFILLAAVYSQLDFSKLKSHLIILDLSSVLLIFFLYTLGQLVNTFKWRIFLHEAGIRVSQLKIIKAFFLGMSVNAFGIGTVGGDFTRAISIPCEKGQRGACFATVLADRIHGLITLLLIGSFSITLFSPVSIPDYILIGLFLFIGLLFFSWFIGPRIVLFILPDDSSITIKLDKAFKAFPKKTSSLILATVISFIFHSIQILMAYSIFTSIGKPLSLELAYCTIPFINAASALPFSINGLGVREYVGVNLLQPAGVFPESTVAFAAIWIIAVTIVGSLSGLLIILCSGDKMTKVLALKTKTSEEIEEQHI